MSVLDSQSFQLLFIQVREELQVLIEKKSKISLLLA